jgi:hypothetical protein
MMIRYVLFASILAFTSCTKTALLNRDELRSIPKGTKKIIASSSQSPEETYITVSKIFAKNGCPVTSNKESLQVICNGKSVEGGTSLKAMAFIEPSQSGSTITFSGEWGLDGMGQAGMSAFGAGGISGSNTIIWEGVYPTKSCIAFQHMMMLAKEVSNTELLYEK